MRTKVDMEHSGDCQKYCALFSDYIDQELAQQVCRDLEQHLKECPNCQVVVDTLTRTIKLYQETKDDHCLTDEQKKRLFVTLSLEDYIEKP
jgi:predicted anti-sigma-YlaC factor YlaD